MFVLLTPVTPSDNFPANLPSASCLYLSVDNSMISFDGYQNRSPSPTLPLGTCAWDSMRVALTNNSDISLIVNSTLASQLYIDNDRLHPWNTTKGDIGLGYPGCESCPETTFMQLLDNIYTSNQYSNNLQFDYFNTSSSTAHRIFGIDFNGENGVSSIQLGGVLDAYASSLVWSPLFSDTPSYHELMISDLSICEFQLFGNYSTNYPVLFDTGAVCLSLPAEIYDSLLAWTDFSLADELPSLFFSLASTGSTVSNFTIPLSSLLINASLVEAEAGMPLVGGASRGQRLCVLRSSSINDFPAPNIVFGTLVLKSLYLAADMTQLAVGIASKVPTASSSSSSSSLICKAQRTCIGDQSFSAYMNTCLPPNCGTFYFTELDTATQTCRFTNNTYGFGIFILLVITVLECLSFFAVEFTSFEALSSLAHSDHALRARTRIDCMTVALGRLAAGLVDVCVLDVFKLVPRTDANVQAHMQANTHAHVDTNINANAQVRAYQHNRVNRMSNGDDELEAQL